jgi:hypothetical protein
MAPDPEVEQFRRRARSLQIEPDVALFLVSFVGLCVYFVSKLRLFGVVSGIALIAAGVVAVVRGTTSMGLGDGSAEIFIERGDGATVRRAKATLIGLGAISLGAFFIYMFVA